MFLCVFNVSAVSGSLWEPTRGARSTLVCTAVHKGFQGVQQTHAGRPTTPRRDPTDTTKVPKDPHKGPQGHHQGPTGDPEGSPTAPKDAKGHPSISKDLPGTPLFAKTHSKCMAKHGTRMANAQQTHGKSMATPWQTHAKRMANAWQSHGKRTANAWQTYGRANAWHRTPPKGYPRISKGFQGPTTEPHGIPRAAEGKPQGSSGACLCFVLVQRHACPCTLNGVTQTRFPFTRLDRFLSYFIRVFTCFRVSGRPWAIPKHVFSRLGSPGRPWGGFQTT